MKMQGFRVREVMAGHSSTSVIVGEDAQGRELRLEVTAFEGASVRPGELLVLNWATIMVPSEVETSGPRSEVTGTILEEVDGRAAEDVELVEPSADDERRSENPRSLEDPGALAEFKALIGLQ